MRYDTTLILGAVAYDPKVVTIWDGFLEYFARQGLPFDYVLYSNYERQVISHLAGHVHVAWNSPLAWVQTERLAHLKGRTVRAVAMRDSDCDLTSLVIVRSDSDVRSPQDLRGRTVAVGAEDSPQATLIPLHYLAELGVEAHRDFVVQRHDLLVGKHGDHIGGERDAARALMDGSADAACMIESNHQLFSREGILAPGATRVLVQTPLYDHCNFTVLDGAPEPLLHRFEEILLRMSYEDPSVRRLLDLEGLKAWRPGRASGYEMLSHAVDRFGTLNEWIASTAGMWGGQDRRP